MFKAYIWVGHKLENQIGDQILCYVTLYYVTCTNFFIVRIILDLHRF